MTTVLVVSSRDFVLDRDVSPHMEVVGRTGDPQHGIDLAERLQPEVIVWAQQARPADIRDLRRAAADSAILVLGPRERWWELEGAVDAGADGYATDATPLDATIRAFETARRPRPPRRDVRTH